MNKTSFVWIIVALVLVGMGIYTIIILIPYQPQSPQSETVSDLTKDVVPEFTLDLETIYTKNNLGEAPLLLAFNENFSSWAYDESSEKNHGRMRGPSWTEGKFGSGLLFDGIDDYIYVEHSDCLAIREGITMMAWIKPRTTDVEWMTIFEKVNNYWGLYLNEDRAGVWLSTQEQYCIIEKGNFTFEAGSWYFVAGTYDLDEMRLYVNGNLDSSTASGDCYSDIGVTPNSLVIGGNAVDNNYFNGVIDEVAVYNRSLSGAEISQLYNQMMS